MTKKIRVGIIDDDPSAVDFLCEYVSKTAGLVKAFEELDPHKGLVKLMSGSIDLLIVDMEMNTLSGMELIAQIQDLQRPSRKSPLGMQVIICSGHDQYAAESYQYDVTDYLSKPLAYQRFIEAINKVKQKWNVQHPMLVPSEQIFLVKIGKTYHSKLVRIDDIICVEADGMECKLWFANDTQIVVGKPLSYMFDRLPRDHFIRCHRSFVINTRYVMDIYEKKITMRYLSIEVFIGDRKNYTEFNLWEMANRLI